jgi:hypothetical protein
MLDASADLTIHTILYIHTIPADPFQSQYPLNPRVMLLTVQNAKRRQRNRKISYDAALIFDVDARVCMSK